MADLREFAKYLNDRTEIPVAITSNHDWRGGLAAFEQVYAGGVADVATWHFSRDRRTDAGWKPVYDCWEFADRPGFPPASSNEPIGPGSSVNTEAEPIRLVMAAAFAYAAKLPMYVFHCEAGVFGKARFQDTPAIDRFSHILRLLPPESVKTATLRAGEKLTLPPGPGALLILGRVLPKNANGKDD